MWYLKILHLSYVTQISSIRYHDLISQQMSWRRRCMLVTCPFLREKWYIFIVYLRDVSGTSRRKHYNIRDDLEKVSTRYPTMSRKDIKRYWLIHISAIFSILHAQSHCRMSSNQTHFMEHSSGTERYFFLVNYFPMKTISLSRYPSPFIDSLCLRSTVGKVMRPSRTVDLSVRSKIMFAEDARFHKENAWNIKTLVQIKDIS